MGRIPDTLFTDFTEGQTVHAADLTREREIMRVAINDFDEKVTSFDEKIGLIIPVNAQEAIVKVPVLETRLTDIVTNVKTFGAKGDGVTDDTQAIRDAIASMTTGGKLYFPKGQYLVSKQIPETNNYIFKIDRPIKIRGAGFVSRVMAKTGTPTTVDIFYISPDMNYGGEFYGVEDLLIYPQTNTDVQHAFHIDVSGTGQHLSKFYMSDVYVQQHGGKAVRVTNAENKADGFFASTFERCTLYGGVHLERAGDSIVLRDCTMTGKGRGLYIKLVGITAQSNYASQVIIDNCNITSEGGAVLVEFAKNISILGGNIEQTSAFAGHVIDISGSVSEVVNFTLERVHVGIFGFTGAVANNVRLDNVNGATIDKCTFGNEVGGTNIILDVNSKNVKIGKNSFGNGVQITDNGQGASGILKSPTLLNSWVDFNNLYYSKVGYFKDRDGWVHLKGLLKDGTKTLGTVIFNLPTGFRPKLITPFFVPSDDTGALIMSEIQVKDTGEVVIQSGGNTRLSLDGIKFLAE